VMGLGEFAIWADKKFGRFDVMSYRLEHRRLFAEWPNGAAWVTEEARENIGAAEAFAACERAAVEQARASLVALAERAQAEGRSVRIGSPPTMQIQHDDDVFASFLTVKVEAIVSEPQRLGVA